MSMETHPGKSWTLHPSHLWGSGLSSLPWLQSQELQGQELSLQIALAEELLGKNVNQDASPVAERHDDV